MTFKSFIAVLIVSVLTSAAIGGISVRMSTATDAQGQPVEEFVVIANGIKRTDDLEKGVSCYKYSGGSMSCVKVSP